MCVISSPHFTSHTAIGVTMPPPCYCKALHLAMDTGLEKGAGVLPKRVQENGNKSIAPVGVTIPSTRLKFDFMFLSIAT